MSNPNYKMTLTHYHKGKRSVYKNCFFKCGTALVVSETQAKHVNSYIARISQVEGLEAEVGDLIVLGEVEDEITGEKGHTLTEVMNRYKPNSFRVTSVSDNTSFPAPHWKLGG